MPEYWFVDLGQGRILVFRVEDGRCAEPDVFSSGDLLESKRLPGFGVPVDRLLNPPSSDANARR